MQGKLEEAIQHYSQALAIDPHYAGAKQNLEQTLRGKRDAPASPWRTTKP